MIGIIHPVDRKRQFARISRELRRGIIEHYRERGEAIDDESGLRTLDTNSILVPERAELLIELHERRSGSASIEGMRVADLGCGFGAISLYLASLGASVVGVDPKEERFEVSAEIAADQGLAASFQRGWAEELPLPDAEFDLVVINNSLCYLTGRSDRRRALEHVWRISRPGARIVMRNPSRGALLDPFTGLPLVHQVPAALAAPALKLSRRGANRSEVRLMFSRAARRELRRAGFDEVRVERVRSERRPARYQHLTARRPDPGNHSGS